MAHNESYGVLLAVGSDGCEQKSGPGSHIGFAAGVARPDAGTLGRAAKLNMLLQQGQRRICSGPAAPSRISGSQDQTSRVVPCQRRSPFPHTAAAAAAARSSHCTRRGSKKHLLKSFVFRISRMMRGTLASSCTSCGSRPPCSASVMRLRSASSRRRWCTPSVSVM